MSIEQRRADSGGDEFGPRGYLPERAAKRARKIILREQMGLGWPIAALIAALLVALAGTAFVLRTGPPGDPFMPVGALETFDPRGATIVAAGGQDIVVVRAGGGIRAFQAPADDIVHCPQSRLLESPTAGLWTPSGRAAGDTAESLRPVAVSVYDGVLYISPHNAGAAPARAESGHQPGCL